ncbi:hypothetical protein LXL04_006911 [Taraxacum kok-saghyz]
MNIRSITLFNKLDEADTNFTVKVHILKMWTNPSKFDEKEIFSLDMILVDEQGQVIQATIVKYQFHKFLKNLKEGSTNLLKSKDFSGSTYGFSFVDYGTILSNDFPHNCSVDVIGAVVPSMEPHKVKIVNDTKKLILHIRNLE